MQHSLFLLTTPRNLQIKLLVERSFAKQSVHEQNVLSTLAECAHVHAAHVISLVLTTVAFTHCLRSKNGD